MPTVPFRHSLLYGGYAWTWGLNTTGVLGDATAVTGRSEPTSVLGNRLFQALYSAKSDVNTQFGLDSSGYLWAWGAGTDGRLGNNSTSNQSSPVSVLGDRKFIKIAFAATAFGLDESSYAWGWAYNGVGNLGDGTVVTRSSPVSILGGRQFQDITNDSLYTTYALDGSGYAWAWGSNGTGCLGDNTVVTRSSPVSVVGGITFSTLISSLSAGSSPGADTAVALDTSGYAWAWGNGNTGQLGNNSNTNRSSPVSVVGGRTFTKIAITTSFSNGSGIAVLALDSSGYAWAWGANTSGQLGDGTTGTKLSPVSVVGGRVFTSIYALNGLNQSLQAGFVALDSSGYAWAWGGNVEGKLGDGTTSSRSSPVSVLGGKAFTSLVVESTGGVSTVFGINEDDITKPLWMWGYNANGRGGDGTGINRSSPVAVVMNNVLDLYSPMVTLTSVSVTDGGGTIASTISMTATFSKAVTGFVSGGITVSNGTIANFSGTGTTYTFDIVSMSNSNVSVYVNAAAAVDSLWGTANVKSNTFKFTREDFAIMPGGLLDKSRHAWAWGAGLTGQLGNGFTLSRSSPVSVLGGRIFSKLLVNGVFPGSSEARDTSGYLWAWGSSANGRVGDGFSSNRSSPVSVIGGRIFTNWVSTSGNFVALDQSGYAYAWGQNNSGMLGDGTASARFSPVSVIGARRFMSVETAAIVPMTSFGLDVSGFAWAWGAGTNGLLGNSNTLSGSSPVSVLGGKRFTKIVATKGDAAHGESAYGLDLSGFVWSWGANDVGQLGDGTANYRSSPVSVLGDRSFADITVYSTYGLADHTVCAIDASGYAWTWGAAVAGKIGDGQNSNRSSPVSVVGDRPFTKVEVRHGVNTVTGCFIGLDYSGQAWAWGGGQQGMLGNGGVANISSPVSVLGGKVFTQLTQGGYGTAYQTFGYEQNTSSMWAWGSNSFGQLGDNTIANRSSPVAVLLDINSPTVSLTSSTVSNGGATNSSTVSMTATFSEVVTGFSTGGISIAGGSVSGLSGSGTTYTFSIDSMSNGVPVSVSVLANSAYDLWDNPNSASSEFAFTYDTVRPDVTVSSPDVADGGSTGLATIDIAVEFTKPVTGFIQEDVSLTNCTLDFFSGSGTSYTFTITPESNSVSVVIPDGVAVDAAGNTNAVSNTFDFTSTLDFPVVITAASTVECGDTVELQLSYPALSSLSKVSEDVFFSNPANWNEITVFYTANGRSGRVRKAIEFLPPFNTEPRSSALFVSETPDSGDIFSVESIAIVDTNSNYLYLQASDLLALGDMQITVGDSPAYGTDITFGSITTNSVDVFWGAAHPRGISTSFDYRLIAATSLATLDTIQEDKIPDGTLIMDWTSDVYTYTATGLTPDTKYFFAVMVHDNLEGYTLYPIKSVQTEPLVPFGISITSLDVVDAGTTSEYPVNMVVTAPAWIDNGPESIVLNNAVIVYTGIGATNAQRLLVIEPTDSNVVITIPANTYVDHVTGAPNEEAVFAFTYAAIVPSFDINVSQISKSSYIDESGYAWGWGPNAEGNVGDNTSHVRALATRVAGAKQFTSLARNGFGPNNRDFCVGMDTSGKAWAWGDNSRGQLGNGDLNTSSSSPVSVLGDLSFLKIVVANDVIGGWSLGLDGAGTAWAWGANEVGQLGINTQNLQVSPVSVFGGPYISVFSGNGCYTGGNDIGPVAFALDASSYAWAWGSNLGGKLGIGSSDSAASTPVSVIGGIQFEKIVSAQDNTNLKTYAYPCIAGLDVNGFAWQWGNSTANGDGSPTLLGDSIPISVAGGIQFVDIAGSGGVNNVGSQILGLDTSGYLWAWGDNRGGQLGNGQADWSSDYSSPISVMGDRQFSAIIPTNGSMSCALDTSGYLWAWGYNSYGQLGDGTTDHRSSPVSVLGGPFLSAYYANFNMFAVDSSSRAWSWGLNTEDYLFAAQLGDGTLANRSSPVMVGANIGS